MRRAFRGYARGDSAAHSPAGHRLVPVRVTKNGQLIRLLGETLDLVQAFFDAEASEGKELLRVFFEEGCKKPRNEQSRLTLMSISRLLVPRGIP